jgi:hypothetical protein
MLGTSKACPERSEGMPVARPPSSVRELMDASAPSPIGSKVGFQACGQSHRNFENRKQRGLSQPVHTVWKWLRRVWAEYIVIVILL